MSGDVRDEAMDLSKRLSSLGVARALYPFAGRAFEVRPGISMAYLDEGPEDAPVVVMVHGNPTWSFMYRDLVIALRARWRCVVPDHVGMGLSDKPGDDRYDYTLASRVADLEALLARVAPRGPVRLVVHDWGGMIASAWAVRHPERIATMVVMNTAAFRMPEGKRFPLALALARTPLGAALVRGANAFARAAARICVKKRPLDSDVRRAYLAPYRSWSDRIATLRFVEDIPLGPSDRAYRIVAETEEALHRLAHVPTMLAFGLADFVFDIHFLEAWRRHLPRAEVHAFPAAGHYVLEDERDTLIPAIARFLERQVGA